MEDGSWKMEDGRWKMEDGRWKMEDGSWKMEDEVDFLNKRHYPKKCVSLKYRGLTF